MSPVVAGQGRVRCYIGDQPSGLAFSLIKDTIMVGTGLTAPASGTSLPYDEEMCLSDAFLGASSVDVTDFAYMYADVSRVIV